MGREREARNRLLTMDNKLTVTRGEMSGGMGETVELLHCTPETNVCMLTVLELNI